jgi:hypothetical protein
MLAIWFYLYAPDGIVRVKSVDLAAEYRRSQTPGDSPGAIGRGREIVRQLRGPETLEQYVARETADRLFVAEGPAWQSLFAQLEPNSHAYFRSSQPPFDSAGALLQVIGTFRYVQFQDRFVTASVISPAEASRMGADARMIHPRRALAAVLLLGGLAFYLFIPRMKRVPGALRFGRWSGVILPDFLGVALTSLFFTLPLLIVPDFTNCTSRELFTGDHIWFFVFLWPFALAGISILLYAARYASFQIVIVPHGLQWMIPGRTIDIPFSQISGIEEFEQRTPRWLVVLGVLVSLVNWRAIPHAANLRRYRRLGINIHTSDGRTFRLWQDMPGFDRIAEALSGAGHALANS